MAGEKSAEGLSLWWLLFSGCGKNVLVFVARSLIEFDELLSIFL